MRVLISNNDVKQFIANCMISRTVLLTICRFYNKSIRMFLKTPVAEVPSLMNIQGPNLSTKTGIKPFSFDLNPEQPIMSET